jgi:peptidoglycan-associated lipoprotein
MKAISTKNALALIFSASILAGCSTTGTTEDADTNADASGVAVTDQAGGAETYGQGDDVNVATSELEAKKAEAERLAKEKEAGALREIRTFYFDFDKSSVKPGSRIALMAHAAFLAANPNVSVTLEGHSDERGTKEYNLALGERRGQSVERFLVVNGVARTQLEVISFGEEKPAAAGHDESSWAKNRRVMIQYK